jgi:hypothetical protein
LARANKSSVDTTKGEKFAFFANAMKKTSLKPFEKDTTVEEQVVNARKAESKKANRDKAKRKAKLAKASRKKNKK